MLIPPLFTYTKEGAWQFGELIRNSYGLVLLGGMAVSLVGIVVTGMAGMSKEKEMSEEQKKSAVAEFDFKKGVILAVFSGAMSAGMEFGFRQGDPVKALAKTIQPVTADFWLGLPVLVMILLGGLAVNLVWCFYLGSKNRTLGDFAKADVPVARNFLFAACAGAIWYAQMLLYTTGDTKIGEYAFAGWSIIMSSQIIFSSLLGIYLKEWKGTSSRTRLLLAAGLAILILSLVLIGWANELKPKTPIA